MNRNIKKEIIKSLSIIAKGNAQIGEKLKHIFYNSQNR